MIDVRTTEDPFAPALLPGRYSFDGIGEANVFVRPDPIVGNVLACDLGTAFGFALRTPACIASGALKLGQRASETRGDRLLRLYRWFGIVQRAAPLDLIAYELVQHMGERQRLAAHCYAQFESVLLLFAARHQIPVKSVHTGTLKKAITGTGRHPKGKSKEAMQAAVEALGFTPHSYDEADAIAVLVWATR